MSIEFFLTSLVVVLIPGSGVIYTLAVGLDRGFHASVAAAFGCTLGILPSAAASIAGLAALFHSSALAFQLIKYAGIIYLLYIAWNIMKSQGALTVQNDDKEVDLVRIGVRGTLINVLNPKLSLFFLAFLPQFVPHNVEVATFELAKLAAIFIAMTFVVFVGYGAAAASVREYVIMRPQIYAWINKAFATMLGLLALRLTLTD